MPTSILAINSSITMIANSINFVRTCRRSPATILGDLKADHNGIKNAAAMGAIQYRGKELRRPIQYALIRSTKKRANSTDNRKRLGFDLDTPSQ